MRVFVDTNVLVSAVLSPHGTTGLALSEVTQFHKGLVGEYNIDELKKVFYTKFQNRFSDLYRFFVNVLSKFDAVPVPENEHEDEFQIRVVKDRPVLRAVIKEEADILLTGDKDFLESGIKNPIILTPADLFSQKQVTVRSPLTFLESVRIRKLSD